MWLFRLQTLFVIVFTFHQVQVHAVDLTHNIVRYSLTITPSDAPKINNFKCKYDEKVAIIAWQPKGDGENIKHYTIEFSTAYTLDEWTVFSDKIGKISYVVVMKPGVSFKIRVIAIYKDGKSSQPSEPTEMCTTKPDVPYTNPNNVNVMAAPSNELIVSWTPMPQLIHNGPGFYYHVYWKKGSSNWNIETITDWQQDKYVIKNVPHGKYEIEVKAGNSLGVCRAIPRTILGYSDLHAPNIIKFVCHEKQAQMSISWAHFGNTENIEYYMIEYNATFAPNVWSVLVDKTDANFHVVPLSSGVSFSFRVIAKYKDAKPNQISEPTEMCTIKPNVPYTNPTNVYVKGSNESNELVVSWKPMSESEHNGPDFFYRVYWRKAGSSWNQETITNWKEDKYAFKYLPSAEYEIKVIAGNKLGESKVDPIVINI